MTDNKKRLIDANALKQTKIVERKTILIDGRRRTTNVHTVVVRLKDIKNAPTVDAVEVVHGRWILNDDGSGTCKNCHRTTKSCWDYDGWMNYCPNCGAKMDGE